VNVVRVGTLHGFMPLVFHLEEVARLCQAKEVAVYFELERATVIWGRDNVSDDVAVVAKKAGDKVGVNLVLHAIPPCSKMPGNGRCRLEKFGEV
jgi:hypothetical protein